MHTILATIEAENIGGLTNIGLSHNKIIPLDIILSFCFFNQQKQLWTMKIDILLIRFDVDLLVFTLVGCSLEHGNSANWVHPGRAYPHYYWCSFQAKFNSAGNIVIWYECTPLGCCRSEFSISNAFSQKSSILLYDLSYQLGKNLLKSSIFFCLKLFVSSISLLLLFSLAMV